MHTGFAQGQNWQEPVLEPFFLMSPYVQPKTAREQNMQHTNMS